MAAAALLALAALGNTGPLGRYAHCAVRLHDAMYIYGGRGFARSGRRELVLFSDMWVFSVETIAWDRVVFTGSEAGLPMPGPRSSHACAAADDKTMYLFGGMAESVGGEPELADDLWRFELSSRLEGVWRRIKPVGGGARPTPRSDHALLATSTDTLFLAGGCDSRVAQPDAWRFSLSSSRWELVPFDDDGDDAARRLGGEGVVAGAADGGDGASAQEGTELEVGAAAAGRARSRGLAEDAAVGALANDTLGNGTADNQTDGGAVVLPPTRLPGARCAHTASATAEPSSSGVADLILFGGRISVSAQAQDDGGRAEEIWGSLGDAWRLRTREVSRYLRSDLNTSAQEPPAEPLWAQLAFKHREGDGGGGGGDGGGGDDADGSEAPLLNRSDHAALVHGETLYVFGGLYTDLRRQTVYILKDLVALSLKKGTWQRLGWGPAWRFGHTMVDDPLRSRFILYGGAGGMEVFNDVWIFEYSDGDRGGAGGEWTSLSGKNPVTSEYPTLIMSLMMGGAGFVLCACMLLSLLLLRVANRVIFWRGGRAGARPGGVASGAPGAPEADRGAESEAIEALPVRKWVSAKAEKQLASGAAAPSAARLAAAAQPSAPPLPVPDGREDSHADGEGSSGGSAAPAAAAGEAPAAQRLAIVVHGAAAKEECCVGSDDDDDDGARSLDASLSCVVCLMEFEEEEEVCTLPCEHLFHKSCIHKWLRQEGSCPQCRRRVGARAEVKAREPDGAGARPAAVGSPSEPELSFPAAAGEAQPTGASAAGGAGAAAAAEDSRSWVAAGPALSGAARQALARGRTSPTRPASFADVRAEAASSRGSSRAADLSSVPAPATVAAAAAASADPPAQIELTRVAHRADERGGQYSV